MIDDTTIRRGWLGAAVLAAALATGCATAPPQMPIAFPAAASASAPAAQGGGRIGVAMTALPAVDTSLPGAGCLLCAAAAAIANSEVTAFAKKLPYEDLPRLKQDVAERLKKRGFDAVVIDEPVNLQALQDVKTRNLGSAEKEFAPLRSRYGIDRLLLIEIKQIGFERTYSAYVPTSDPKAVLRGRGYLVNLATNAYEWYSPVNVLRSAEGKWDEPPKFPGLTNAYFQTIELGRDSFLGELGK